MPDLLFNEADRVGMGDHHGRIVTVNHDDPANVIYLVAFDQALHEADGEDDITIRTAWVYEGHLELVETGLAWVLRRRDEILSAPIDEAALAELQRLRALHDKLAGVDPMAEVRASRAAEIAAGFGQPHPAGGPGHD